jgi:hypothetical protein
MKYLMFVFLVLIISCDKGEDVSYGSQEFSGVVLDYTTGFPVSEAHVTIYRAPGNGIIETGNEDSWRNAVPFYPQAVDDTTRSDASGIYHLMRPALPQTSIYQVFASKEGFLSVMQSPASFGKALAGGTVQVRDTVFLDRPSYIRFRLNNAAQADSSDTLVLKYWVQEILMMPGPVWIPLTKTRSHTGIDSIHFMDSLSARQHPKFFYSWQLKNNGILNEQEDSVQLIPFTVNEISIDY